MNQEPVKEDVLGEKSYSFAIRIVKLSRYLQAEHKEYVLSRQVLKSGTAIGALIREAAYAQSRPDFINKMSIALKEANETEYWLLILKDTDYLEEKLFDSLIADCKSLLRLLIATIKTSKFV